MTSLGAIGGAVRALPRALGAAAAQPVEHAAAAAAPIAGHTWGAGIADAQHGVAQLRIGILTRGDTGERPNCALLIQDALRARGVEPVWLDADATRFEGDRLVQHGAPVGPLDFVVVRYPREQNFPTMDRLQAQGVGLLNDTTAINTTKSKVNSELAYRAHGTPSIPTNFAYTAADADASLAGLSDKIVVKPFDGEGGHGVEFFDDHASAKAHILEHFSGGDGALIVQDQMLGTKVRWTTPEGVETESGMDYRVLITRDAQGAPYIDTIMQRIGAPGSGRSNIDGGGWGRNVDVDSVPQDLKDAALAGYDAIPGTFGMGGVDVMGVGRASDQALDDHSAASFVVTETNSSPGIPDVRLQRDFAGAVAEHAIRGAQLVAANRPG